MIVWPRRRIYAPLLFFLAAFAVAPANGADPFTVVVLPDTQYYTTADDRNDLYFKGQTNWIVNNRQNLNLAFVLHVGDIQNNGNPYYADGTPTPWLNGGGAIAWVDGDLAATSGAQPTHSLIRFDQIFSADAIPLGATIDDAMLTLHTNTATNSQTNNTISLYRLLRPWDESSTWNSLTGGISADALEAILAANGAVLPNAQGGTVSFDVTESLAAWSAGAPNYGWVLLPGGTDGWRWDTSESLNVLDRPLLDVAFTTIPEPAAIAVLALASGVTLLGRRRVASAR